MRLSDFREAVKGTGAKEVRVEFDGVPYLIRDMRIEPASPGRNGHPCIVYLLTGQFNEDDGTGITEDDFV